MVENLTNLVTLEQSQSIGRNVQRAFIYNRLHSTSCEYFAEQNWKLTDVEIASLPSE
jgi:hypothetical protein